MRILLLCLLFHVIHVEAARPTIELCSCPKNTPPITNDCILKRHYSLESGDGVYLSGSLLYWTADEEGHEYAIREGDGATFINDNGTVFRLPSEWNWGARAEISYEVLHQMDLTLNWTGYWTTSSDSITTEFPSVLFSSWSYPGASLSAEKAARSAWKLKMNLLDFLMSTVFSPLSYLDLSPSFGLSTGWIHQSFNVHLNGGVNTQTAALVLDDHILMRNKFWGIGPKVGLSTTWVLPKGFNLFGNLGLALLYGTFDLQQNETITYFGLTPPMVVLDIAKNQLTLGRLYYDFYTGISWTSSLNCERQYVEIEAGWEMLIFQGQSQWMRFTTDGFPGMAVSNRGDLTFQGFTAKFTYGF
jgi:hypothetical protein